MRKETERTVRELDVARLICNLSLPFFLEAYPIQFVVTLVFFSVALLPVSTGGLRLKVMHNYFCNVLTNKDTDK